MATSLFEDGTVVFKRPTVAYVRQPDTMYVVYRGTLSPRSWRGSPSGTQYIAELSPRQMQHGSTPKDPTIRNKLLKLSKADEGKYTLFKLGDLIERRKSIGRKSPSDKSAVEETVYEIFKFNSSGNWVVRSKGSSVETTILPGEEKNYERSSRRKLGGKTQRASSNRRNRRKTQRKR
jgi:hypothetical protein